MGLQKQCVPQRRLLNLKWALRQITEPLLADVPDDREIPADQHTFAMWNLGVNPTTTETTIFIFAEYATELRVFAVDTDAFTVIPRGPDACNVKVILTVGANGSPTQTLSELLCGEGITATVESFLVAAGFSRVCANFSKMHAALLRLMVANANKASLKET